MLPLRLQTCANLVRVGSQVADIGTDHALLPCYLAEQGFSVIAADVNQKPLEAAARTIEKYQKSERVTIRLSDGLQQIAPDEVDDVIIAGMGGELIGSILLACTWAKNPQYHFILQPMSMVEHLRNTLAEHGFAVQDEIAVQENGHQYTVLSVYYDGVCHGLDELTALVGLHLHKKQASSVQYLMHHQKRLARIVAGLEKAKESGDKAQAYQTMLRQLDTAIEEGMACK